MTGRPRLRTASVLQDLISAIGFRSDGPDSRVLPSGGGWSPELVRDGGGGSGIEGEGAPVVPGLGEDDDDVQLGTAKRMARGGFSFASWSGG